MKKLTAEFYRRANVVQIAKELLGKVVVTRLDSSVTAARIVETEAYSAAADRASHAYNGRRTARNEAMYAAGGTCYVYICYGMHQMFNVVTNAKDIPDAVLIRAAEPLKGMDIMLQRSGKKMADNTLTRGPGNLARALGLHKTHSGLSLLGTSIAVCCDGFLPDAATIGCSKRIGVDYAGADALLPYRFYLRGNRYVSGRPVK